MSGYVLGLGEVGRSQLAAVGGKGAALGDLSRLGVGVPGGCCVTTAAFERFVADVPGMGAALERLAEVRPEDWGAIRAHAAALRAQMDATPVPDDVAASIQRAVAALGEGGAFAVRSSATAEDLPTASFAGQHDSYLNVEGTAAVLERVRRCWASLFTERAVAYRLRGGFDHRAVSMAVVVQRMVPAEAAGVLFTADPLTGNREVSAIEACVGLGEALVSGAVSADAYHVREGVIVAKAVAHERVLTDAQVLRLAQLGRRIEAHFGRPQDIEWCLVGEELHVLQSRPITTLFPVPAAEEGAKHVYISVGHQQMMTDAMKPLGIALFQLTAARPMFEAGGRLFVEVAQALASPASRAGLLAMFSDADPLIGDALQAVVDRPELLPPPPPSSAAPTGGAPPPLATDPAIVDALIERAMADVAATTLEVRARTGVALLDFILADLQELKLSLFLPQRHQVLLAAMEASAWLNANVLDWLGEKNVADTLTRSVPHNVTSEMGLALLDVADAIRQHPEVVAYLQRVQGDAFLDELPLLPGGRAAAEAIARFLHTYGARCVGEIDITRPRWAERPSALIPLILGNVRHFAPGEAARRFERGQQQAAAKEQDVLARLRALPDGAVKADEVERMIRRLRTFAGYREHPKFALVSRYWAYKQALLGEAERLVQAGVLGEQEDIFYLDLHELREVVRTQQVDGALLHRRKESFVTSKALTPPRVFTSAGEVITGRYRRGGLPEGALVGLAVSAGTVEGRARVLSDMAQAALEPGDILVTAFTDPSWTPLFVSIAGLVTEVGGLTTHGAVIAREYGVPAVVGVERATQRIRDGQRIRVHGAEGYVELLAGDD